MAKDNIHIIIDGKTIKQIKRFFTGIFVSIILIGYIFILLAIFNFENNPNIINMILAIIIILHTFIGFILGIALCIKTLANLSD